MGSATRQALAVAKTALAATEQAAGSAGALRIGAQLFRAGEVIGLSGQLRQLLADPSSTEEQKKAVVEAVFGSQLDAAVVELLVTVAGQRWSATDDVLAGIEELGLRAIADSAEQHLTDREGTVRVRGCRQLQCRTRTRGRQQARRHGVEGLPRRASARGQGLRADHHDPSAPGAPTPRASHRPASAVGGRDHRRSSRPVGCHDHDRGAVERAAARDLGKRLSASYGRALRVNQVIDARVLGGVRVQVGDDIIDGSISSRLNELKLQLVA